MPPIGMLTGKVDFASLFYVLDTSKVVPASLAEAKAKGIPRYRLRAVSQRRDQFSGHRLRNLPDR
jgi:hypothetical protein